MDSPAPATAAPPVLTALQARLLGCLIEKEATTPEVYPLSFNSLILACNQKSNRDPVMEADEKAIQQAIEDLRITHHWVGLIREAGARVPKYRHEVERKVTLDPAERAVLCELLLRGPQTAAELRARASRIHPIPDAETAERALQDLMNRPQPLVARLPPGNGRREARFMHLLSGVDVPAETSGVVVVPAAPSLETSRVEALETRVCAMESELAALRQRLEQLVQSLGA